VSSEGRTPKWDFSLRRVPFFYISTADLSPSIPSLLFLSAFANIFSYYCSSLRCTQIVDKDFASMKEKILNNCKPGHLAIITLGLLLIIVGSRLLLLQHCGTDIPQYDAWGIEGDGIYKPYLTNSLKIADFFAPCNEHRVALTRLLSLILLMINGLWDNQMQSVVNALIYSMFGTLLFLWVANRITAIESIFWGAIILAAFALPFGWANALWGFQSQFYLMVVFSVALIFTVSRGRNLSFGRILLIAALQFISLFTMASGVLASVTILALSGLTLTRSWHDKSIRDKVLMQSAISLAVILFWKYAVYIHPADTSLNAVDVSHFANGLVHGLSWPFFPSSSWWIISWLPWVILVMMYLFRKMTDRCIDRFAIALGIWALLQTVAIAYARNPLVVDSKYADLLSFGMIANGLAIIVVYDKFKKSLKTAVILFALMWSAVNGYSLYSTYEYTVEEIVPAKKLEFSKQFIKTYKFNTTGNVEDLFTTEQRHIPDRNYKIYASRLRDPIINPILPRSINQAYNETLSAAPLSQMSDFLTSNSATILAIGVVTTASGLILAGFQCLKRRA
jgi:hypothetical protein